MTLYRNAESAAERIPGAKLATIAARACARVIHSLPRDARQPVGLPAQGLQLAQYNSHCVRLNTSRYRHLSR